MSQGLNGSMNEKEIAFVTRAARYLESPSFLIRVTDLIGMPIEKGLSYLPQRAQSALLETTRTALEKTLAVAASTVVLTPAGDFESSVRGARRLELGHTAFAAMSGAVGGFFGVAALPLELPLTTGIMLRSIASIAHEFGHDIRDPHVRLECLSVFSMGSPSAADDAMESAYFASRIAMARLIDETAKFIAHKTAREISEAVLNRSAPVMIRFIASIATRFEVVVTEKAMAQALPLIGAAAGAGINGAFTDHFNSVARYHFGLMALEKKHGVETVRALYELEAGRVGEKSA